MVRPEGAPPEVVDVTLDDVVGVVFDANVAVAAMAVLVAFRDVAACCTPR